jgi:hypothetical protein
VNLRPGAMLATPAVLGSGRVFVDAAVDGDCASAGELRGRSRSGYIGEPGRGGEDDRAVGQLFVGPSPATGPERFQQMMTSNSRRTLHRTDRTLRRQPEPPRMAPLHAAAAAYRNPKWLS